MSLTTALNVALSGLSATTTLLQLTSNNISNASTPGFTRKSAAVSSTQLGSEAGGVAIVSYTRATDTVLQQSFDAATSDDGFYGTKNTYLKQVQTILGSTSDNPPLSVAIADFAAAWTQLQASPEDPTVQTAVVQAGNNFARQINAISSKVTVLQAQVTDNIEGMVTQLNNNLESIYKLNLQIFVARGQSQPTGNLEDQRDKLVNEVAALTKVTVFERNQGQIALYTPDGVSLLDGTPQTFSYASGAVTSGSGLNVTGDLVGGSLQAAIQFNTTTSPPSSLPGVNTIQKLQAQIQEIINAFANGSDFATAYNPGGVAANDFFTTSGSFAVNSALISDPTTIPEAVVADVATTFTTSYNFTDASAGLSLPSGTYTDLVTTILSGFQQAANTVNGQSQSALQQKQYYQQTLSNATGVNIDNELVNLTTLQNSYAASAHVISTINKMYETLMQTI